MDEKLSLRLLISELRNLPDRPRDLLRLGWLFKFGTLLLAIGCISVISLKLSGPSHGQSGIPTFFVLVGLTLILLSMILNITRIAHALWNSERVLSTQLDAHFAAEESFAKRLSDGHVLTDLQRCSCRIDSSIKRFEKSIASLSLLTAATSAVIPVLPGLDIGIVHQTEWITGALSSLALGFGLGAIAKHDVTQLLLRLDFVIKSAIALKEQR